ncbi:alpha/beta hydrolase [Cohnella herbarum]|nr:alpha/beta hydrolase [Cohnella herbarum]
MMNAVTIPLYDHNEYVRLEAYLLHSSDEFQLGRNRPAVIVCPGGGYLCTSDREAEPVALRFAAQGYQVFVLRYTTYFKEYVPDLNERPPGNPHSVFPQPLYDLALALLIVRRDSAKWRVDPDRITIVGFSAGGHLAACLGVHWADDFLYERFNVDRGLLRPDALILGYPLVDHSLAMEAEKDEPFRELVYQAHFGHSNPTPEERKARSPVHFVTSRTPPTFLWHTADDDLVDARNSMKWALALAENKVPYELHIFESGVHGLSLADETSAAEEAHMNASCRIWFELALSWLRRKDKILR